MKLQHIFSRKSGSQTYKKWQVTLPSNVVEQTGWEAGTELDVEFKQGRLTLRPATTQGGKKKQ